MVRVENAKQPITPQIEHLTFSQIEKLGTFQIEVQSFRQETELKPGVLTVIIPGFLQEPGDDPLPFIAQTAAEITGSAFVVSSVHHPQHDVAYGYEGQYLALSAVLQELAQRENAREILLIGHSLGGTKAVNALGVHHQQFEGKLKKILCLCSPAREDFLALEHWADHISADEGGYTIGNRRRKAPRATTMQPHDLFDEHETSGLSIERRLRELAHAHVRVTNASIINDPVVAEYERLKLPGVKTRRVKLQTQGLTPSQVHNWVGEENRAKLKQVISDFVR